MINAIYNNAGQLVTEKKEIADALNEQFRCVFVIDKDDDPLPQFNKRTDQVLINISISYENAYLRLSKLNINKSQGPGLIHPMCLQRCASSLASPLTLIFNESLRNGEVP